MCFLWHFCSCNIRAELCCLGLGTSLKMMLASPTKQGTARNPPTPASWNRAPAKGFSGRSQARGGAAVLRGRHAAGSAARPLHTTFVSSWMSDKKPLYSCFSNRPKQNGPPGPLLGPPPPSFLLEKRNRFTQTLAPRPPPPPPPPHPPGTKDSASQTPRSRH